MAKLGTITNVFKSGSARVFVPSKTFQPGVICELWHPMLN